MHNVKTVEFNPGTTSVQCDDGSFKETGGYTSMRVYRIWAEVLRLLEGFDLQFIKIVVFQNDGSYVESLIRIQDLPEDFVEGFHLGEEWVFPDLEKVFFNPFLLTESFLTIPCFRHEQLVLAQHQHVDFVPGKISLISENSNEFKVETADNLETRSLSRTSSFDSEGDISMENTALECVGADTEATLVAEMMVMSSRGIVPTSSGREMVPSVEEGDSTSRGIVRYSPSEVDSNYHQMQSTRKLPKKGTSCHQCKNTKHLQQLAFCTNTFEKRSKADGRTRSCRKKFCKVCLQKFYNQDLAHVLLNECWTCPSCCGQCVCAACVRARLKPNRNDGEIDNCLDCSDPSSNEGVLESSEGGTTLQVSLEPVRPVPRNKRAPVVVEINWPITPIDSSATINLKCKSEDVENKIPNPESLSSGFTSYAMSKEGTSTSMV